MAERMVVMLRENLDWVELHGMPRWTDDGAYPLDKRPKEDRFPGGDVLVWSDRDSKRYVYVGKLINARVEGTTGGSLTLRFDKFERFQRPVVVLDGAEDNTAAFYEREKGFANDFAYIPEEAFDRAVAHANRRADG